MTTPSAQVIQLHAALSERGEPEAALGAALVESGQLAPADLERALRLQGEQRQPEPLVQLLAKLGLVPERELASRLADHLDLPLVQQDAYPEHWLANTQVAPPFQRSHHCLIVAEDEESVSVAMADPFDRRTQRALSMATGRRVDVWVAVPS